MRTLLTTTSLIALLLAGCGTIRLVSDYDEVVDKGMSEFTEQLNTHVKNMAELGGKPEGSYEANFKTYNALESKLDVLIARASTTANGQTCKLEAGVHRKISALLLTNAPPGLAVGSDATAASESACNTRLLTLVREQLSSIREIHRDIDKCKGISCLRPATAKDAMAIANQSANAVLIVEAAKKSQ